MKWVWVLYFLLQSFSKMNYSKSVLFDLSRAVGVWRTPSFRDNLWSHIKLFYLTHFLSVFLDFSKRICCNWRPPIPSLRNSNYFSWHDKFFFGIFRFQQTYVLCQQCLHKKICLPDRKIPNKLHTLSKHLPSI